MMLMDYVIHDEKLLFYCFLLFCDHWFDTGTINTIVSHVENPSRLGTRCSDG